MAFHMFTISFVRMFITNLIYNIVPKCAEDSATSTPPTATCHEHQTGQLVESRTL